MAVALNKIELENVLFSKRLFLTFVQQMYYLQFHGSIRIFWTLILKVTYLMNIANPYRCL